MPCGKIKVLHANLSFHPVIFEWFSFIFRGFLLLALPPLWAAVGESSDNPWPPDWHHHDCLEAGYQSILVITTGIAAIAAKNGFRPSIFYRRLNYFPAPASHLWLIRLPKWLPLTEAKFLRLPTTLPWLWSSPAMSQYPAVIPSIFDYFPSNRQLGSINHHCHHIVTGGCLCCTSVGVFQRWVPPAHLLVFMPDQPWPCSLSPRLVHMFASMPTSA